MWWSIIVVGRRTHYIIVTKSIIVVGRRTHYIIVTKSTNQMFIATHGCGTASQDHSQILNH